MDTFYRFASGGSSIEQFARDVYCKGHLTQEIHSTVKTIMRENQAMTGSTSVVKKPSMSSFSGSGIILCEASSPSVSDLCSLLEAALLQGLKEKLSLSKMTAAVLGPRSPIKMPSKSSTNQEFIYSQDFWPIIQILCHNQVSESLMRLTHVHSDIGRCRAWLRLTLNEGLLGSYMEALTNDTSLLHGFYRSSAYLRDKDHMELLKSILADIDSLSFQLNYDSPCLNSWPNSTLKMIGFIQVIKSPEPDAVMPAVDALDELNRSDRKDRRKGHRKDMLRRRVDERSSPTSSLVTHDSRSMLSTDGSTDGGLSVSLSNVTVKSDEDRIDVDIIVDRKSSERNTSASHHHRNHGRIQVIQTPPSIAVTAPSGDQITSPSKTTSSSTPIMTPSRRSRTPETKASEVSSTGNSLTRKSGWSSSPPKPRSSREAQQPQQDYSSMFAKYVESTEVALSSTPDVREIVFGSPARNAVSEADGQTPRARKVSQTGQSTRGSNHLNNLHRSPLRSSPNRLGRPPPKFTIFNAKKVSKKEAKDREVAAFAAGGDFEVIPKSIVLDNSEPSTQEFLLQLNQIGSEVGLDQQDYKCYSCGRPIGMIYGRYRSCKFDGYNYCIDCHKNDEAVIPSRVLFNWDFKRYHVSKKNKKLLDATESDPLLDVKVASPLLYTVVPELATCLDLRTQLFFLHAYIFTCQESVALELRKIVWPKEHLFEHVHLYSVNDITQVVSGQLLAQIRKAITFARKHVLSCSLCSQKGFICELCSSPQIIYPFDTSSTRRCEACKAVFHRTCVTDKLLVTPGSSTRLKEKCPRCLRIRRRKLVEESASEQ